MEEMCITINKIKIPLIETQLDVEDILGAVKVRLGLNRMGYKVNPGLYAIGKPVPESEVFVTGNYKLSFDMLRKELDGLNAYILVLDTKGVNVWCASGKGIFGTEELLRQIEKTQLKEVINHKELILPQLGAPGVSGYKVTSSSGFKIIYGPIRARDIKAFLDAGKKADKEMRNVSFDAIDRMVLIPVEMRMFAKHLFYFLVTGLLVSGLNSKGYSLLQVKSKGMRFFRNTLFAYLCGSCDGPILLPWLPGKSFSVKGAILGIFAFFILFLGKLTGKRFAETLSWFFLVPVICSFQLMNFTGASTFTSLSGVKKEMAQAVPMQKKVASAGIVLWIYSLFSGDEDE